MLHFDREATTVQSPLREASCHEPKPEAVTDEQLEGAAAAIAKDKESAGERVFLEHSLTERCQPIDTIAKVDRLTGEEDSQLRDELDHGFNPAGNRHRFALSKGDRALAASD